MTPSWSPMPRYNLRKLLVKDILSGENPRGKSCLEIGYGAGDMLRMYAEMELNVHGFDFSHAAYETTRQGLSLLSGKISKRITLMREEENFFSRRYDYVMAFEVLEHIEDDVSYLKKCANWLYPGGKLLLSVPAHMSKWGPNDAWAGHFRRYERNELERKLILSGYHIESIWSYIFPLSLILDPMLHGSRAEELPRLRTMSIEDRTKRSGVTPMVRRFLKTLGGSSLLVRPFHFLQRLFLHTDLGSGYLAVARKA